MPASFWFLCALLLTACADSGPGVTKLEGNTMGTRYHITLVGLQADRVKLQKAVERELETVNRHLSTYRPDSELSRFNRAPIDQWIEVSQTLFDVLRISHRISELSGGAFDPTVGPLVDLWGFGPEPRTQVPAPQAVARALQQVGYRAVAIHPDRTALRKTAPVSVDLSGVAKGYGVDRLARLFDTMGALDYLVEIGGELRLKGVNAGGRHWRIGIETPSLAGGAGKAFKVTNAGVATSGDYRNYYEIDGKRYSHTIDPRTGYPIDHPLASVTVVAPTSAEADALATALNVLGPTAALALATKQDIAAYFIEKVDAGFREYYSPTFEPYLP
ncbi:FAD:protein FMN transferase [Exilibacterium tricleocarpae]|uniref:FAD:protein FMN transferase n=1 Tax=Exilibacterium tricleocarpae TaxID=2591008 RepID=A0A545TVW1_9GAMM|nr:FAD:protein FMN transferase [Exilibacterium tricleocarpae]TQV81344.1 FAD:protein FMN transferase [Exilibacterium tricleocarpae]